MATSKNGLFIRVIVALGKIAFDLFKIISPTFSWGSIIYSFPQKLAYERAYSILIDAPGAKSIITVLLFIFVSEISPYHTFPRYLSHKS